MGVTVTIPDSGLDDAATTDADEPASVVTAYGLRLDGRRGRIYGPVDLEIAPASLNLVTGAAGSGKTSLLLTMVGRMRPNRGAHLTVLGRRLPSRARGVQRRTAAVGIHGLDDLDEEVSVAATIREREAWLARWYRIVRPPDDQRVAEVCSALFGDSPVPLANQLVHQLDEAANLRLRLALALLGGPDLVVVDDIDSLHDMDSRRLVWESLRALTGRGVTVVASAATAGDISRLGWETPPTCIPIA